MAKISKEDLRKEITAILKDPDLVSTLSKLVRLQLEDKLGAKLLSQKEEIDDLVMELVNANDKNKPEKKKLESEEEEEEEGSKKGVKKGGGDYEEEYAKKSNPAKTIKLPPKKKKDSDSDCDEDWGKSKKGAKKGGDGGGEGYIKIMTLSPELAALVGQNAMARHVVVKKVWAIIKERGLYDPHNKQYAICDDALYKVIGVKRFRTFGMMKYLKNHLVS